MKTAKKPSVIDEINITPLTDIFLVLLIIMMVVAPLLEYRQLDIAVASPTEVAEEEEKPDEESKTIVLRIDNAGAYTVDGEAVPLDGLVGAIRAKAPDKPDGLLILTHPESDFEDLAKAMDAARRADVVHLNVAPLQSAPSDKK